MKKIAVIAFLAFISTTLFAKVKLPGVLADNMVLQQQSQVKLWGEAETRKHSKHKAVLGKKILFHNDRERREMDTANNDSGSRRPLRNHI